MDHTSVSDIGLLLLTITPVDQIYGNIFQVQVTELAANTQLIAVHERRTDRVKGYLSHPVGLLVLVRRAGNRMRSCFVSTTYMPIIRYCTAKCQ